MDTRRCYVVRSVRAHGNISYNCPTSEWALKKLRDFLAKGDTDVTVLGPHGTHLSEADLINLVESRGEAPAEVTLGPAL